MLALALATAAKLLPDASCRSLSTEDLCFAAPDRPDDDPEPSELFRCTPVLSIASDGFLSGWASTSEPDSSGTSAYSGAGYAEKSRETGREREGDTATGIGASRPLSGGEGSVLDGVRAPAMPCRKGDAVTSCETEEGVAMGYVE